MMAAAALRRARGAGPHPRPDAAGDAGAAHHGGDARDAAARPRRPWRGRPRPRRNRLSSDRVLHAAGNALRAAAGRTAAGTAHRRYGSVHSPSRSKKRAFWLAAPRTRFGASDRACRLAARPRAAPGTATTGSSWRSVTALVRIVLEHEAIQRELARQARTDPLTGLLNRRAFVEEAQRRIDRLEREGLPGTLMFIDLDRLKPLNDRLGHEAGDAALQLTSTVLRRIVRPSDLVARLGGDEFALWLDGFDEPDRRRARRTPAAELPARSGRVCRGGASRLTMSIGIACRQPGERRGAGGRASSAPTSQCMKSSATAAVTGACRTRNASYEPLASARPKVPKKQPRGADRKA